MTKKHFIELANIIRETNAKTDMSSAFPLTTYFNDDQINILARFCRSQNPNFDWGRWIGYIKGENGPNGGAVKGKGK